MVSTHNDGNVSRSNTVWNGRYFALPLNVLHGCGKENIVCIHSFTELWLHYTFTALREFAFTYMLQIKIFKLFLNVYKSSFTFFYVALLISWEVLRLHYNDNLHYNYLVSTFGTNFDFNIQSSSKECNWSRWITEQHKYKYKNTSQVLKVENKAL